MELKAVYFVTASNQRWGKGLSLVEALKGAGLKQFKSPGSKRENEVVVFIGIFKKETTDLELENLRQCITADQMWGTPMFYTDAMDSHNDPTHKEDHDMINRLFIGWVSDMKSFCVAK